MTVKVVVVALPPSETDSVIVAGPPLALLLAFAAGVRLIVRLAPEPPRTMFAFGTSAVLLEVAVTIRLPAPVSASPTVKAIGPSAVFSSIVWSVTALIVGANPPRLYSYAPMSARPPE